jgi:hypothetical protein
MIAKTFTLETHEEYGEIGLRPSNEPNADPLGGMSTAHDMLEHMPGADFGVADELIAFGAILYVRGKTGWWAHQGRYICDPVDNMVAEMPEILRHIEEIGFMPAPSTRPLHDEYCEERIQRLVLKIPENAKKNGDVDILDLAEEHTEDIRSYLRIGVQRARRRYRHHDIWNVMETFNKIMETADKEIEHYKEWADTRTEVRISANIRHVEVHTQWYCEGEEL